MGNLQVMNSMGVMGIKYFKLGNILSSCLEPVTAKKVLLCCVQGAAEQCLSKLLNPIAITLFREAKQQEPEGSVLSQGRKTFFIVSSPPKALWLHSQTLTGPDLTAATAAN